MPDIPGIAQLRRSRHVLPTLSLSIRTAFVAAAAARTLPVLEDVVGPRADCRLALDLCWRIALNEGIDREAAERVVRACEDLVGRLYDEDESGAPLRALNAISWALQSALHDDAQLAVEAASDATDAAHSRDAVHGDEHIEEEAHWQGLALDLAVASSAPSRSMFDDLPAPPRWLASFSRARALRRA